MMMTTNMPGTAATKDTATACQPGNGSILTLPSGVWGKLFLRATQ